MSKRAGFSLPELIIVVTITAVILAATYSVLVTNQRTYTVQNAQIQSQQTVRAAMEILSAELREVSSNGGDIIAMNDHSLTTKSLRKLGIVCGDIYSVTGSKILTRPVGDGLASGDTIFIFADNRRNLWNDDVWIESTVTGTASYNCDDGTAGQDVDLSVAESVLNEDSVRIGAPVRSYKTYDYYVDQWSEDGRWYLFRDGPSTTPQPLVGPLRGSDGVTFEYLDIDGNVTTTPANVTRIRVTVATLSPIREADGSRLRDSLVAIVHTRN